MPLDFDLETVDLVQFGVGLDDDKGGTFFEIPVNENAQGALIEMAGATWDRLKKDENGPTTYDPAEKHADIEYLSLPLSDELATPLRNLHEAANIDVNTDALNSSGAMYCYFARMRDGKGRRLTALRRATQFKGILKSHLLRFISDSLTLIEDHVFKLDGDFDLLIDSSTLHILRPSGFEFAGKLKEAILQAVPQNIKSIRKDLPFVDFASIEAYAGAHPRAARHLASIQAQRQAKNIDEVKLKDLCKRTNVVLELSAGKITVSSDHVLGFLEVLDRRRYHLELVKGDTAERFRAASRTKIP